MALIKNRRKTGGVPLGGSTGQVIKKNSNTDYDYAWGNDSAGTLTFPPGTIIDYAGLTAPTGWLNLDGNKYSTTTYADLFTAIGCVYSMGWNSVSGKGVLSATRSIHLSFADFTSGGIVYGPIRVYAYSGAALPSGLAINTDYYMRYTAFPITSYTFSFHSTFSDASGNLNPVSLGPDSLGTNGFYTIEDSGSFRVPYGIGLFRRQYNPSQPRTFGSYQADAFQGFKMRFNLGSTDTSRTGKADGGAGTGYNQDITEILDGGYGVPRISTETRPVNWMVGSLIKT